MVFLFLELNILPTRLVSEVRRIDFVGMFLFVGNTTSLLLGLPWGGSHAPMGLCKNPCTTSYRSRWRHCLSPLPAPRPHRIPKGRSIGRTLVTQRQDKHRCWGFYRIMAVLVGIIQLTPQRIRWTRHRDGNGNGEQDPDPPPYQQHEEFELYHHRITHFVEMVGRMTPFRTRPRR